MANLRTNADAGLRARQLLSQLSSLTQVEVEISRLVTSTKRTALRVSAQLRTLQSGHTQQGVGGAVLGMLGGSDDRPLLVNSTHDNAHEYNVISGCYQIPVPLESAHHVFQAKWYHQIEYSKF